MNGIPKATRQPEYWRVQRVAQHLDVSRKRVYQLVNQGLLEAVRLGPRTMRIDRASIDALLEARRDAGDAEQGEDEF